jgi:hypothetical protein
LKYKQKTTSKNVECTMGSFKRRNQETYDLNHPSPIAQNKSCIEMGGKLGKAPSLKEVFFITTIVHCKIMAA